LKRSERGFSLVALMASVTIMMVMLAAAVPSWKYLVKNDQEEELIFRGGQIADAIRRYQAKNGNALPPSIDALVKGRFLRRAYTDPMTKDGKWRLIRQGEPMPGVMPGAQPSGGPGSGASPRPSGAGPAPSPSPSPSFLGTRPGSGTPGGTSTGVIAGVASLSTDKSLRLFNNRDHYNDWWFVVGQPRIVGKQNLAPVQQGPRPGAPAPQRPAGTGAGTVR
jgi:type II secretory pathway pseudopilin PulG